MAWTVPLPPPPDGWFYSRCSSVETLFRRVAYGGRKDDVDVDSASIIIFFMVPILWELYALVTQ